MEEYRVREHRIEAGLNFPKQESESEDMNSDVKGSERRSCAECHATKTPLWRSGPAGPRSLCNACGIRYRKKRKLALNLDMNKEGLAGREKKSVRRSKQNRVVELEVCSSNLESFMVIDSHVIERSKLREEERAAIMLMALSCGSIFA